VRLSHSLVGSRPGAALLRFGLSVAPRFLRECLTNRTVSPFPVPASSNPACGFSRTGLTCLFLVKIMRLFQQGKTFAPDLRSPSLHAVLNTPVDRIRCSLVGELRVPARAPSLSTQPSPFLGRVGVHNRYFRGLLKLHTRYGLPSCSPTIITRLHPSRLPGSGARQLTSSTNNLLGWVLPPLVICAVEAHA
jgi:hypothetical protein